MHLFPAPQLFSCVMNYRVFRVHFQCQQHFSLVARCFSTAVKCCICITIMFQFIHTRSTRLKLAWVRQFFVMCWKSCVRTEIKKKILENRVILKKYCTYLDEQPIPNPRWKKKMPRDRWSVENHTEEIKIYYEIWNIRVVWITGFSKSVSNVNVVIHRLQDDKHQYDI